MIEIKWEINYGVRKDSKRLLEHVGACGFCCIEFSL